MKIYETLPVSVSYQNFGSSYLIILRGPEEAIEATFNGCYNFGMCSSNAELDYRSADRTVATFWSNEYDFWHALKMMRINHFCLTRPDAKKGQRGGWADKAEEWAMGKLNELKEHHEPFLDYLHKKAGPETAYRIVFPHGEESI